MVLLIRMMIKIIDTLSYFNTFNELIHSFLFNRKAVQIYTPFMFYQIYLKKIS